MHQKVVPIRKKAAKKAKTVACTEKAIEALPYDSGTWTVENIPGLYIRCRAKTKTFVIQRRVDGKLAKKTLGDLTAKQARAAAMREWSNMRPKPAARDVVTLETAFNHFLGDKQHAEKTRTLYRYNLDRYLADWKDRTLPEIGADRPGVKRLWRTLTKDYGPATANQVIRLVSAVYRWARREDPLLPDCPTVAVDLHTIRPRDWALDPAALGEWWAAVRKLAPVKRQWWMTCLFTGARRGSVEALRWADVDLERKTILFRVTKGDRPYTVPIADKLAELLEVYRKDEDVPPSEWVFPSTKTGGHIVDVRNDKTGVRPAHALRHTYRTVLAELGASSDQARMLMGHSMGGDVSRGYITAPLLVESLRPVVNAVAARYCEVLEDLS